MENLLCFGPILRGYSHQTGFDPQLKQAEPWMMIGEIEVAAVSEMPTWAQKVTSSCYG